MLLKITPLLVLLDIQGSVLESHSLAQQGFVGRLFKAFYNDEASIDCGPLNWSWYSDVISQGSQEALKLTWIGFCWNAANE